MRRRLSLRAAARAVVAASLFACSGTVECEPVSCPEDGLTVRFETEAWEAGAWTVTLGIGDETFACPLNLPVTDLDAALCGQGRVTVRFADGYPAFAFWAGEAPEDVDVTVAFGEDVRLDATLPISEDTTYPGGPGCPPTCFEANATAAW